MGEVVEVGGALRLDDRAAFSAFYSDALPKVFGYFMARCANDLSVAEDLTQETFMAAVKELRNLKKVEAPMPWIVGIARHKLVDFYRGRERHERRLSAALDALGDGSVSWSDDDESRDRAVAALGDVPVAQRTALVLRFLDGLPVADVANAIGKTVHATESLLMRGKASFRRAFEGTDHA